MIPKIFYLKSDTFTQPLLSNLIYEKGFIFGRNRKLIADLSHCWRYRITLSVNSIMSLSSYKFIAGKREVVRD